MTTFSQKVRVILLAPLALISFLFLISSCRQDAQLKYDLNHLRQLQQNAKIRPFHRYNYFLHQASLATDKSISLVYIDSALSLYPEDIDALGLKASTLYELGDYENSLKISDKTISIHPDKSPGYLNRAIVRRHYGMYDLSNQDYFKALEIGDLAKYNLDKVRRGVIYQSIASNFQNMGSLLSAKEYIDLAIGISTTPGILKQSAIIELELENYSTACSNYRASLKLGLPQEYRHYPLDIVCEDN